MSPRETSSSPLNFCLGGWVMGRNTISWSSISGLGAPSPCRGGEEMMFSLRQ